MIAAAYLLVLASVSLVSAGAGATIGALSPMGTVLMFTGGVLGAVAVMVAHRAGRMSR